MVRQERGVCPPLHPVMDCKISLILPLLSTKERGFHAGNNTVFSTDTKGGQNGEEKGAKENNGQFLAATTLR